MKILKFIIIGCFLFSCVNEKSDQNISNTIESSTKMEKDNSIRVYLKVKVMEDDKFQLFYISEPLKGKYEPKDRIQKNVEGKNEFQTIVFQLPEDILPYKFRIDLGEKGHETSIEIDHIEIKLNKNKILIDSTTIHRFFQKNIYLDSGDEKIFSRKKVSGKYDPFLTSTAFLIKKIELEL